MTQKVLEDLDIAHSKTQSTLQILKDTSINPLLQQRTAETRSLVDFLDNEGVVELTLGIQEMIDMVNKVHKDAATSNQRLDEALKQISSLLEDSAAIASDLDLASIAPVFHSLEAAATDMADLLQSLVKHYDLCMVAIKHIEGGDEAAQATLGVPADALVARDVHIGSSPPISIEELDEMMQVLEKDALEVDNVVEEIHDHALGMEANREYIRKLASSLENEHLVLDNVTRLLLKLDEVLPNHIKSSMDARAQWHEARQTSESRMQDLEAMDTFFGSFLTAYDGLILEIVRRQHVASGIEKVAHDAMTKLSELRKGTLGNQCSYGNRTFADCT